jgi:hypothetical protein
MAAVAGATCDGKAPFTSRPRAGNAPYRALSPSRRARFPRILAA